MRVITRYLWLSLEIGKQISMSKDKLKEESWLSLAWDGVTISRSSFIKLGRLIHACRNVVAAFNPCCCCWCSSAYRVVGEEKKRVQEPETSNSSETEAVACTIMIHYVEHCFFCTWIMSCSPCA